MNERHSLWAFLAVLGTIIVMAICATVALSHQKDASAYLASITGLIGVIGTFRPRNPTNSVERADTVNQGAAQ